jgi:hypothetical protein
MQRLIDDVGNEGRTDLALHGFGASRPWQGRQAPVCIKYAELAELEVSPCIFA